MDEQFRRMVSQRRPRTFLVGLADQRLLPAAFGPLLYALPRHGVPTDRSRWKGRIAVSGPVDVIPSRLQPERLAFLDNVIELLAATDPESWWPGPTYRSPDGTRHCCLSHIFEAFGSDGMDRFESQWSTVHVIGRVNDGKHDDYPQHHPKDRVLAFLANLRSGVEEDTEWGMEMEARFHDAQRAATDA